MTTIQIETLTLKDGSKIEAIRDIEKVGRLLADSERIDKLAMHWDSQGKGHHLMGAWLPNVTGSFRDAVDAYRQNNAIASTQLSFTKEP